VNGEIFESCPSFAGCSCNDCPLDPASATHGGRRFALGGEEACRATKASRERVAVTHGLLASWGWTARELEAEARRSRWLNVPDVERARRVAGLVGKALQTRPGAASDGLPAEDEARPGVDGPLSFLGAQSPSRAPEVRS
jgi:hypothetical protein